MKWATAIAVSAVLVASCGGGTISAEPPETVPPPSSTTTTTTETSAAAEPDDPPPSTAAPSVTSEPIVVDGPPAPDFALALDDGRGFILSDEAKPVYMVFWAEW